MILRDIVKIENEKPEREEKGMGEVKQTNFRVDKETADKFRQFCMDAGMNQAQGFDHVMEVLEMDRAKEAVPGRATEIEVVNAVTEKEREMNAKILQVERENAKLQAKIELLEARLGKEEEVLSN